MRCTHGAIRARGPTLKGSYQIVAGRTAQGRLPLEIRRRIAHIEETMKPRILILGAIILAVAAIALATRSLAQRDSEDPGPGGRWEYLVVSGGNVNLSPSGSSSMRKADGAFSREAFPLEQNLDKLGARGWELVAVTTTTPEPSFFFKRRR